MTTISEAISNVEGTFRVDRWSDGSELATVRIEPPGYVWVKWDGDEEFTLDDDGMGLLISGDHKVSLVEHTKPSWIGSVT
jgi:hypothetical protein